MAQWFTNTTDTSNTTIGLGAGNKIVSNGTGNLASVMYSKITYHVLGEDIEVSGYYDTNLIMIIATLNILKKPYYDELKKNNFKFPEEIDNFLRIGFRDDLIDKIMKPTF